MKTYKIIAIGGDGVGPELVTLGLSVLTHFNVDFQITHADAGYGCYQKTGASLPDETIKKCKQSDAILFGAVTTPPLIKNYKSPIVTLRRLLGFYANVRPVFSLPVKQSRQGIDIVIVRENTEDLYSGREKKIPGGYIAERVITKKASEAIITFAFKLAKAKRKKVTVVHKANVLRLTDGLFLECAKNIAKKYLKVEWNDMLVDSCALQLIRKPEQFGIIVTTNMFGDILSDEAAGLVGGLGVAASANIGKHLALFEPVHGSAPKYEGLDKVNPVAMLFAINMMLEYLKLDKEANQLKRAILKTMKEGIVTYDLGGKYKTSEVIDTVIKNLQ